MMVDATGKWLEEVSAGERTSVVAARTLEARLAAVQRFLPLAAESSDEDVEYVHRLRVATRRATAAIRLFADLLPRRRARWLKKQFRRIRRAAQDARDYDVLLATLSENGNDSLQELRSRRAEAQQPIVAIYQRLERSDRLPRRIAAFLKRVRPRGKKAGDPPFSDWARARLRPVLRKFLRAVPRQASNPDDLHRFRIRGKQLRYAMELLAPAFPSEFREELYPVVEELQDKLGEITDRAMALERLKERGNDADDSHAREQRRLEEAMADFRAWWTLERQEFFRRRMEADLSPE